MSENEIKRQTETAKRIFDLIPFWDRPGTDEETMNEIFNTISTDPVAIIDHLLDILEDMDERGQA